MTKGGKSTGVLVCMTTVCLLLCAESVTSADDDCQEARKLYDKAVQLMNYAERRDAFERAVDLCPSYVEAHVNLADAFENLGQFEKAEQHYRTALEYRPAYHLPYIGIGEVCLKTGRFSLAKEAYVKGLDISPGNERLSDGLQVILERLKREKNLFPSPMIETCLVDDENFRLMCMCPDTHYEYLKRWICIPPIFFSTGSSMISSEAKKQLDEIGKALRSDKLAGKEWTVIGHADNTGDAENNLRLSKGRAATVRHYLVEIHGVNPKSLKIKFLGQVFPRASNTTSDGRCENRRVEIVADSLSR
jgi:tetratricopeptide (TPR) repeat protein